MKPTPRHNFPVAVQNEVLEEPASTAHLFEGIFSLTLNHTVSISFVPEASIPEDWRPRLAENTDLISSTIEARQTSILLSRYSVTPDELRAGTIQRAPRSDSVGGAIFFVGNAEFQVFTNELRELCDTQCGPRDTRLSSELADRHFMHFVRKVIIDGGWLSERDAELLGTVRQGGSVMAAAP